MIGLCSVLVNLIVFRLRVSKLVYLLGFSELMLFCLRMVVFLSVVSFRVLWVVIYFFVCSGWVNGSDVCLLGLFCGCKLSFSWVSNIVWCILFSMFELLLLVDLLILRLILMLVVMYFFIGVIFDVNCMFEYG